MKYYISVAATLVLCAIVALSLVFVNSAGAQVPVKYDLYIRGTINDLTAYNIADSIGAMNALAADQITIHITSPGGSVLAGFQIYDAMMESRAKIITSCEGYCMSMAAIILAAGDTREAGATTTIMFHTLSAEMRGNLAGMYKDLEEAQRLQTMMDEVIHRHTGLSMDEVKKMESYDHFMNAKDAKRLGVIDRIRGKL